MESLDYEFRRILQQRDIGKLNRMLDTLASFDIGKVDDDSTTALHLASEYGNEILVRVLLDRSGGSEAEALVFKPDKRDKDTAVHMAALGGKVSVLEALLDFLPPNVDVNVRNMYQRTPLHYALGKGNIEFARYLILNHGSSLDDFDAFGTNCLHFAARGGHVEALDLVKEMVQVPLDVDKASGAGLTALHYAAWNNKSEAVKWLFEAGADLGRTDKVEGGTPLHWAAMQGSDEAVSALVNAHVKRSMQVFSRMKTKKVTILELMEEQGHEHVLSVLRVADDNELLDPKAFPESVLVKYVIGYGDGAMNRKLKTSLGYGMEKVVAYRQGILRLLKETRLLDWAARRGNVNSINVVMWLADVYLRDSASQWHVASALYISLFHGRIDFAYALTKYKHGHAIELMKTYMLSENEFIDKPLAYRIFFERRQDNFKKFFTLVNKKDWRWADVVNEPDDDECRRTALHWAVICREKDMVSVLCSTKECRAHTFDSLGKTPYWYAMQARKNGSRREDAIAREVARHEDVKAYLEMLYTDRQVFIDALNSILLAAALIASITFAAFLQPPLGYTFNYRRTNYVPINKASIKVFWMFNSLSFFSAIASSLAAVRGILPIPQLDINEVVRHTLILASTLVVFSIVSALGAFAAIGFSVVPLTLKYSMTMIVTASLGGALCLAILIWFLRGLLLAITSTQLSQGATKQIPSLARNLKKRQGSKTLKKATKLNQYTVGAYYPVWPFLNDGLDVLHDRLEQRDRSQEQVSSDSENSDSSGLAYERKKFLQQFHSETSGEIK